MSTCAEACMFCCDHQNTKTLFSHGSCKIIKLMSISYGKVIKLVFVVVRLVLLQVVKSVIIYSYYILFAVGVLFLL